MMKIILPLTIFALIIILTGCELKLDQSTLLTNKTYSFTINYPSELELKKFGDHSFTLLRMNDELVRGEVHDLAAIDPRIRNMLKKYAGDELCKDPSVFQFGFQKTMNFSFPEGIGAAWAKIYSIDVEDYKPDNGGCVIKLYLEAIRVGAPDKIKVGPYYNIYFKNGSQQLVFLLFYKKKTLADDDDAEMLEDIAESFTMLQH